ncbi:MAG: PD40 domain-containing protein [Bacteroidetes bacterium]|nr:PD40 domain-containing protein [Bacteroidota bacterium]
MKLFLRIFFIIGIFPLSSVICQAQQNYSTKSKKAIKYYEEATKFYDGKNFEAATEDLKKAIKEDDSFIEAHMLLGYIYSDLNQNQKAIVEIKKALGINPDFYPGNYFSLARLQFCTGQYKDAKENYVKFLDKPSANAEMNKMAERDIKSCDFAVTAIDNPVPFKPINAGDGLNSQHDEYYPSITADEQTFLFTRKLPTTKSQYGFQEDFYVSDKTVDGKWGKAYGIGPKINSESNEGAPCLSADGQMLFFVACETDFGYGVDRTGFGSCDIFYSYKNGNDWSKPKNVGPPVCTKWWETQPSFSSDGKTLYFIRGTIDASGKRSQDIYTAVLKDDGKWSGATKLSNKINTPYNEESVFIHPDNQTLYFSSDGHPGMGGLDIFMSRRQANGEWGEPVNLGCPINTFNDENSLLVSRDGKTAWFASDRVGGYGGLDIYSFDLYEQARPGKTIYVKGKVFDAVTKAPLEADIDVVDLQTGISLVKWVSKKSNGEFLICLPVNKNYAFNTSRTGYLFHSENFSLLENKDYQPIAINIPLSPITKDSTVILRNVFFDTDKFDLKDESKVELNKLVDFLNKNPTLKIELSGHTDNVGDKKHNQILSENRAKSVLEYLSANGIAKDRLTSKGYGDTKPVIANDTDEHRQMNRRTEFKVVSK